MAMVEVERGGEGEREEMAGRWFQALLGGKAQVGVPAVAATDPVGRPEAQRPKAPTDA
jgi:hypothetical protein